MVIAITACPYSATRYTKKILCELGFDIGHEVMGKDGIVSWQHCHWHKEEFSNGEVVKLHQIRHPLITISQLSVIHYGYKHPQNGCQIKAVMDDQTASMWMDVDISKMLRLRWAMNIWYWWNRFGIEDADGWYTIESLPDRWEWFCNMIGHDVSDMPDVDKTDNRKKNRKIYSWTDMFKFDKELTVKIIDLAMDIGYDPIPYQYLDDAFYNFPENMGNGNSVFQKKTAFRSHCTVLSDA